jgi:hypothetical protein
MIGTARNEIAVPFANWINDIIPHDLFLYHWAGEGRKLPIEIENF